MDIMSEDSWEDGSSSVDEVTPEEINAFRAGTVGAVVCATDTAGAVSGDAVSGDTATKKLMWIPLTYKDIREYTLFAHRAICYNSVTTTSILTNRTCTVFSAKKVFALVEEFINERMQLEAPRGRELTHEENRAITDGTYKSADFPLIVPNTRAERALLLLGAVTIELPEYMRAFAGVMICALAKYLTEYQWDVQLQITEDLQRKEMFWTEPFIGVCKMIVRGDFPSEESIYRYVETEAEKMPIKMSFMRPGEFVQITYVD